MGLAIRLRSPVVVRVSGSDLGDVYKDDNGHLWRYETRPALPSGEIRAVTDAYGGAATSWVDRSLLGTSDHDETNASIELKAAILGAAEKAGDFGTPGGGGSTPSPTKKVTSPSMPSGSTTKPEIEPYAAAASSSGNNMLFIILGMIGAGLIAWKFVG
jgi:hypothetical protein